ncbi:Hypothetical_protein [Hexamita inflata]|uniref:Hypothetical_protein n=1 Tax=Hexamita inflata TaxID=28002 RepID=A0AA86NN11_9EUKA|nr:Hypothetical protein HINF_LOCUS9964 [Hexamita inflata]
MQQDSTQIETDHLLLTITPIQYILQQIEKITQNDGVRLALKYSITCFIIVLKYISPTLFCTLIYYHINEYNLRISVYELNMIQVKMFINVSWHYRQSLCTRSAKECFDTSSTALWSFQRNNILRQYQTILLLTMQQINAATVDFVAQIKLQFESTKCSKTRCGIYFNLQPTQVLLQQCYIEPQYN